MLKNVPSIWGFWRASARRIHFDHFNYLNYVLLVTDENNENKTLSKLLSDIPIISWPLAN